MSIKQHIRSQDQTPHNSFRFRPDPEWKGLIGQSYDPTFIQMGVMGVPENEV